jgi:DNA mismatch repair protein MutS
MLIDDATLRDLEILPPPGGRGQSLWALVDRTRSRAGREHLRASLLAPCASMDEILERQAAHRALGETRAAVRALLEQIDGDGIERYLGSTWHLPGDTPLMRRLAYRLWAPAWFAQYLSYVGPGRVLTLAMLRAARDLQALLGDSRASRLQAVAAELRDLLADPLVAAVIAAGRRTDRSSLVGFDQATRGVAAMALRRILDVVGRIEAMWCLAAATVEHRWTYPRAGEALAVRGLVHPFLGAAAVPIDLELAAGVRVCFVTGPNMAGKSTFLKAVAIALLLAHAGCGVPAANLVFPPSAAIFSSIQIADDLGRGESFYLAEVRRVGALAAAVREHGAVLGLIDEPFRGTNVHDAAEATLAVVSRLREHPAALIFVASHLAELASSIAADDRIRLLHFSADVDGAAVRFDYQLRDGVSTQRLGMVLLEREGVLALLDAPAAHVSATTGA